MHINALIFYLTFFFTLIKKFFLRSGVVSCFLLLFLFSFLALWFLWTFLGITFFFSIFSTVYSYILQHVYSSSFHHVLSRSTRPCVFISSMAFPAFFSAVCFSLIALASVCVLLLASIFLFGLCVQSFYFQPSFSALCSVL